MTKIAVIGSGVVGSATGKGFAAKGNDMVFTDINPVALEKLASEGFRTCTPSDLAKENVDVFLLSISTPTVDGHIKLDNILGAATDLAKGALKEKKGYCVVVVRSTVPPGTTEEKILPILEELSGKKVGRDFGLCMNPEFLREVSSEKDAKHPWIIVAGAHDEKSHAVIRSIYEPVECIYEKVTIKEAEMTKYTHNLFDSCKIAFFNEMREVCERIGVDADRLFSVVKKSSQASWDPDYGTKNLGPFGGACFPKDTQAFLYWATHDVHEPMPLLRGLIESNEHFKEEHPRKGV